jgi:hypothetical protein
MTDQDIELIRKDMEEEIRSQIQNNREVLQDSKISWDIKVLKAEFYEYRDIYRYRGSLFSIGYFKIP